jgi:hypothetical protein
MGKYPRMIVGFRVTCSRARCSSAAAFAAIITFVKKLERENGGDVWSIIVPGAGLILMRRGIGRAPLDPEPEDVDPIGKPRKPSVPEGATGVGEATEVQRPQRK